MLDIYAELSTTELIVPYGSRLYGTNTPTSDHDQKRIFLPDWQQLLLNKTIGITKQRFDADGKQLPDGVPMVADGVEVESIPLQRFATDFVEGQTYAVEVAHAINSGFYQGDEPLAEFTRNLVKRFSTAEVNSMVGFARKQTFDYVRRGERLSMARLVLGELKKHQTLLSAAGLKARLDTPVSRDVVNSDGQVTTTTVLQQVAAKTGAKVGSTQNNNKTLATLELNGRAYLETTVLTDLIRAMEKVISEFGDRVKAVENSPIEWKSMTHALRVYTQSLELLETGKVTFPRPDAKFLLAVKRVEIPAEHIKAKLCDLEDKVAAASLTTKLPRLSEEMRLELNKFVLGFVCHGLV